MDIERHNADVIAREDWLNPPDDDPPEPNCRICKFNYQGLCVRFPMQFIGGYAPSLHWAFPPITHSSKGWCGEFQEAEE
jgi:hypothetical protein